MTPAFDYILGWANTVLQTILSAKLAQHRQTTGQVHTPKYLTGTGRTASQNVPHQPVKPVEFYLYGGEGLRK